MTVDTDDFHRKRRKTKVHKYVNTKRKTLSVSPKVNEMERNLFCDQDSDRVKICEQFPLNE